MLRKIGAIYGMRGCVKIGAIYGSVKTVPVGRLGWLASARQKKLEQALDYGGPLVQFSRFAPRPISSSSFRLFSPASSLLPLSPPAFTFSPSFFHFIPQLFSLSPPAFFTLSPSFFSLSPPAFCLVRASGEPRR